MRGERNNLMVYVDACDIHEAVYQCRDKATSLLIPSESYFMLA
jgi:hypothetical protein